MRTSRLRQAIVCRNYAITLQVSVLLSIDNLGDADDVEALGYRALRRAVGGGFQVGF